MCVGEAWAGLYACCDRDLVGSKTGNIDRIGTSGCGLMLRCAVLLALTNVSAVENAGDAVRFSSGLEV